VIEKWAREDDTFQLIGETLEEKQPSKDSLEGPKRIWDTKTLNVVSVQYRSVSELLLVQNAPFR